jgi:hypothetical protein
MFLRVKSDFSPDMARAGGFVYLAAGDRLFAEDDSRFRPLKVSALDRSR